MAGYYSILRFVNNPLTDESIALGLVMLPEPESGQSVQAMFRLSEIKVEFAKKLNPGCAKLLAFSLEQLNTYFQQDLVAQTDRLIQFPVQVQQSFIERLATYNNGILQFTEPAYIESTTLITAFERYFNTFIEANLPVKEKQTVGGLSRMQRRVITELYEPLRGKIDVDYTLRKKQLPTLFFDYHLDGLGVNGAMYAVKAVDLNANHHIDTLERKLSEFESVIDRLNKFAKEREINNEPHYYLIVDPYEGESRDRKELYDILQSTEKFELRTSSKLKQIATEMQQRKVGKFSEKWQEE
jgi:hypothetical protein